MLKVQRQLIGRIQELGLTQAQLAKRMGVSQPNVSKMLNREENMTLRSLAVLANALGAEWEAFKLVDKKAPAKIAKSHARKASPQKMKKRAG